VAEAMRRVRADLARRPMRSVVLAHAFVAGGEPSESERDISVGGVSMVASSLFDGISYTALGHLHGRSVLGDALRYSGSPLAYSFSEADHTKGCWLVDLGPHGVESAEFVPAPVPRRLARVRGDLETLLTDPALAAIEGHWIQAMLTDAVRPASPMERLRERFPGTLVLAFAPTGESLPSIPTAAPGSRRDHEVALDFVAELRGAPATPDESALLQEACDACADDPDVDMLLSGSG
jgi:DNA repair protein SbcD/Mre11